VRIALLAVLLLGCPSAEAEEPPRACNGHVELCGRTLDDVTLLRTHNSMSSEERGYHIWSRNHTFAVPTQLADGVRALNYDVYFEEDELIVYHGFRDLGWQPLDDILTELSDFLDGNPNDVVTLDFQQGAPMDVTVAAVEAHALGGFVHTQAADAPWPTLGDMIDDGGRLVVFSSGTDGAPAWMHEKDAYLYGDITQAEGPDDLGCAVSDPPSDHALLTLNNVLTDPIASPDLADQVNHNPFMIDRLERCVAELGRAPNHVSVDYYSRGDSLENTDRLNAVGAFLPSE
jgi:hypothetical protein